MSENEVSVTQRAMALSLAFMIVSCGTARPTVAGPTGPQDLTSYALVFEQQPDGQTTHTWIPLKEFDPTRFQHDSSTTHAPPGRARTCAAGLDAYCNGRYDQCVNDCIKSRSPFKIDHHQYTDTKTQPWRIARSWWCPRNCLEASVQCKKGRGQWAEQYAAEFDAVDPAIDWIKRHRTELVVGAVVVIAGVAFAVVVAGTGGTALALAPLLVIAKVAPVSPTGVHLVEACR